MGLLLRLRLHPKTLSETDNYSNDATQSRHPIPRGKMDNMKISKSNDKDKERGAGTVGVLRQSWHMVISRVLHSGFSLLALHFYFRQHTFTSVNTLLYRT